MRKAVLALLPWLLLLPLSIGGVPFNPKRGSVVSKGGVSFDPVEKYCILNVTSRLPKETLDSPKRGTNCMAEWKGKLITDKKETGVRGFVKNLADLCMNGGSMDIPAAQCLVNEIYHHNCTFPKDVLAKAYELILSLKSQIKMNSDTFAKNCSAKLITPQKPSRVVSTTKSTTRTPTTQRTTTVPSPDFLAFCDTKETVSLKPEEIPNKGLDKNQCNAEWTGKVKDMCWKAYVNQKGLTEEKRFACMLNTILEQKCPPEEDQNKKGRGKDNENKSALEHFCDLYSPGNKTCNKISKECRKKRKPKQSSSNAVSTKTPPSPPKNGNDVTSTTKSVPPHIPTQTPKTKPNPPPKTGGKQTAQPSSTTTSKHTLVESPTKARTVTTTTAATTATTSKSTPSTTKKITTTTKSTPSTTKKVTTTTKSTPSTTKKITTTTKSMPSTTKKVTTTTKSTPSTTRKVTTTTPTPTTTTTPTTTKTTTTPTPSTTKPSSTTKTTVSAALSSTGRPTTASTTLSTSAAPPLPAPVPPVPPPVFNTPSPPESPLDEATEKPDEGKARAKDRNSEKGDDKNEEEDGPNLVGLYVAIPIVLLLAVIITVVVVVVVRKRRNKRKQLDAEKGNIGGELGLPRPKVRPGSSKAGPAIKGAKKGEKKSVALPQKQMEAGVIDKNFKFDGPLVVDVGIKRGQKVEHLTGDDNGKEISGVIFDDTLNRVVDIGSNIERVETEELGTAAVEPTDNTLEAPSTKKSSKTPGGAEKKTKTSKSNDRTSSPAK